ncbi:MAG: hypothetical protein QG567_1707 [Campylobacterota bacterium]|nr:hypothetical protein [Campylobacterota bacterium]
MTIRKNFLLDEEIVKHLQEIAKRQSTTQTDVIKNIIEEKYKEISMQEKIEAFDSMTLFPSGALADKSIQSIKAEMAAKI